MSTPTSTISNEDLYNEVTAWLADNWDNSINIPGVWDTPSTEYKQWLRKVLDARWAVGSWPEQWFGRGLDKKQCKIIEKAFRAVGAPGAGQDRLHLAANTLLTHGTEALKQELIAKLLCAEAKICLLYSEPGAGSDLAAVRTRADRDGDNWLVTGQKVWTSGATKADYGLLLARTDWDQPKHKGISFFYIPMKQAGVEVRPLRQITDEAHFNEVFLDKAVVSNDNLLGNLNDGWKVLQTALAYERSIMGEGAAERKAAAAAEKTLIDIAREHGQLGDPLIRQDIAKVMAYRKLNDLNMARAKANAAQGGSASIMSLGKLAMSRILHEEGRMRTTIMGAQSMLDGSDYPEAHEANFRSFNAYMNSIGGGTDQIQRNIISERVLGLPREQEVDRNIPFREVKSG